MAVPVLLIFDALVTTMDLVGRLVEAQGLEGEDLERYIDLRNRVRKELVEQAKQAATPSPLTMHEGEAMG